MKTTKLARIAAGIAGGSLLALSALAGLCYQHDLQERRRAIAQMGSQVIDTTCGPVEYARVGSGAPVLVVHGNGGGFDQGLGLASAYLPDGYEVIAPSRFGYLRSPVPEKASPAQQADLYACLLDELHIQKVTLFTTSAGVTSSLQFAMRHPERLTGMVLHSPNAPGKVDMQLPPKPVFRAMFSSDFTFWALTTYFGPAMHVFMGVPKDFALTAPMEAEVNQTLKSVLPSSARADGMLFDTFVSNPEINHYDLSAVQVPTLVISAVDDPMALHENARRLAAGISGARLVAVRDGGHLMLGHTDEVRAEIAKFLSRNTAPGRNTALEP